ncbi:MAG: hypothetical protein AAGI92_02740 [Pseudomonadota bacterium]
MSRHILHPVLENYRRIMIARPVHVPPSDKDAPLVVAGLFRTASGIGEGARSTFRMLQDEGKSPIAVCLSEAFDLVDMESPIPLFEMPRADEGTLVVQLNSPELPAALQILGMKRGRSWYVIGYWAWELSIFPPGWDRNFDLVSEIWTPSTFVTEAVGQHPKAPSVSTKGHVIHVPEGVSPNREKFELPQDAKIYITMADSLSSLDRKNPFAAIRYFKGMHGDDEGALLIVKSRNLAQNKRAKRDLVKAIGESPNIRLMDATLSEPERWSLLASVDCLISLHRSEGFGLPIAEAIALYKEVVVTAYSGNMDFCTPENSTLVDYELVPCEDRYGRYSYKHAVWASARL